MKFRNYPLEFREHAIKLYTQSGLSSEQIAEKLGLVGETVHRWMNQHLATLPAEQAKQSVAVAEENKLLRRENARLKKELLILKKAAAYFAKESIPW
jgi:transposase-like protein